MLSSALRWIAFALVLIGATALRTGELSRRPMHADEANQAVKTGELVESGDYTFDPRDHHGPTLYYFGVLAARLRGERTLANLGESTVRGVTAAFGIGCVVLLMALTKAGTGALPVSDASRTGFSPPFRGAASGASFRGGLKPALPRTGGASPSAEALLAGAFLAVCPPAVYYSRYYVHETPLLAFVLLAIFALAQWRRTAHVSWAVSAGVAIGCALATKETALLYFAAALIAYWTASLRGGRISPQSERMVAERRRHVALIMLVAIVTAAAFYSSFGRNFAGLRDAVEAPILGLRRAAAPSGHEKPWWYYLSLLGWQRRGGLVFHQVLLTSLALIGAFAGWTRWHVRAAAIYGAVILLVISVVPYKTPWNVIHVLPAVSVLAAAGVLAIARLRTGRVVAVAFTFLTLATLAAQTYRVAFRYSADARNPYAYVHSSPDVTKVRPIAEAALLADPADPVRIISPEYWPLPWYLRGLPRIGYWSSPPTECDGALVIVAADLVDEVRPRLHNHYRERFLGLRPGFTLVAFVRISSP